LNEIYSEKNQEDFILWIPIKKEEKNEITKSNKEKNFFSNLGLANSTDSSVKNNWIEFFLLFILNKKTLFFDLNMKVKVI